MSPPTEPRRSVVLMGQHSFAVKPTLVYFRRRTLNEILQGAILFGQARRPLIKIKRYIAMRPMILIGFDNSVILALTFVVFLRCATLRLPFFFLKFTIAYRLN